MNAEALTTTTLGAGNDTVYIKDFSGSIFGEAGNDVLTSTNSRTTTDSTIRGEGGADSFSFDYVNNSLINLNSDDDIITVARSLTSSQIYGGRQNDNILVSDETLNSLIRGDANNDIITINGDLTSTTVNGNADMDYISVNSSNITNSTIYGGKGADTIYK